MRWIATLVVCTSLAAQLHSQETLTYTVNWPSGLSLGEATLTSSLEAEQRRHSFQLEAAVPGFAITEKATSTATASFCALEFDKEAQRGQRSVAEKTTFDQKKFSATRETTKGGKSEITIAACAKDALSYIAFLRKELVAGRLPPVQQVYYGAAYQVRAVFLGTQPQQIAGKTVETDRIQVVIKGPASEVTVEMLFARDAVRTPVRAEAALAIAKFYMELSR